MKKQIQIAPITDSKGEWILYCECGRRDPHVYCIRWMETIRRWRVKS